MTFSFSFFPTGLVGKKEFSWQLLTNTLRLKTKFIVPVKLINLLAANQISANAVLRLGGQGRKEGKMREISSLNTFCLFSEHLWGNASVRVK